MSGVLKIHDKMYRRCNKVVPSIFLMIDFARNEEKGDEKDDV